MLDSLEIHFSFSNFYNENWRFLSRKNIGMKYSL